MGEISCQVFQQIETAGVSREQWKEQVEVTGDPFGEPQPLTDDRPVVAIGDVIPWPEPTHIPLMQILVADQLQKASCASRLLQTGPGKLHHRSVVVLQPAVALIQELQHQLIRRT